MPRSIYLLLNLIAAAVIVSAVASVTAAQTSFENFQKLLRNQVDFTVDNFSALEKGEIIVKLLPVSDKNEVAVFGLVRVQNASQISLTQFRSSLTQKEHKSLAESGRFSIPPNLSEIQSFSLEKKDIEALRKCEVGKCDLKLSAAMINRFKTQIDWNSPDYETSANNLFRQMMLDYVADYALNGNKALIKLDDKKKSVRLADEYQSLLEKSLFIKDFAPEFVNYQTNFPRIDLANVNNEFNWSKINFGLKPTFTITQTTTYQIQNNERRQFWVAAKQLYASHYIDASLAFTALLNFGVNESVTETYLLFTVRSRSDSFGGLLGGIKRDMVVKEAETKAKELLQSAKAGIESANKPLSVPNSTADEAGIFEAVWIKIQDNLLIIGLIIAIAVILIIVYRKRK